MTIMDWILTALTGGMWLFWVIPRNIYRRDRNKKAMQTMYRSHRGFRNGRL